MLPDKHCWNGDIVTMMGDVVEIEVSDNSDSNVVKM